MSVSTAGGGWHLEISFDEAEQLLAQPPLPPEACAYTEADFEECSGFLHKGSSSFYAASKLLPPEVRRGTVMLYSFCRLADDMVDELGARLPPPPRAPRCGGLIPPHSRYNRRAISEPGEFCG